MQGYLNALKTRKKKGTQCTGYICVFIRKHCNYTVVIH